MHFEFATATRIVFGPGTSEQIAQAAVDLSREPRSTRALVVTGNSTDRCRPLLDQLTAGNVAGTTFTVAHEPTTDDVRYGVALATETECNVVIAIGGGSAIDAAKAIAALLANGGDPLDYVEVIGRGKPIRRPSVPLIAVPTTAGTGAEVTHNAVLASPEHRVKVSLRSPHMLARLAVVDPRLTHSMPPAVTAATGLDALTQLIEPYVSARANPMTDSLCREGMRRAARSLRRACEQGDDADARADMALASLFGGLALANAGLGAVHGCAGPIGGMFAAPHGAVCAALLPSAMRLNLEALRARRPDHDAVRRYDEIARILTGSDAATAADGIAWVENLCEVLRIPPLSTYDIRPDHVPAIAEKSAVASSMRANSVELTRTEIETILHRAL